MFTVTRGLSALASTLARTPQVRTNRVATISSGTTVQTTSSRLLPWNWGGSMSLRRR